MLQQKQTNHQQEENMRALLSEIELAWEEIRADDLGDITQLRSRWEEFPDIPEAVRDAITLGTMSIGCGLSIPKAFLC